jgi:hypothetical protein
LGSDLNNNENINENINNEIIPRNNINNIEYGSCYDPIMLNEISNVKNYMKKDINNILLLIDKTVICLNRKHIKKNVKLFYECISDTGFIGNDNVVKDTKYGKLIPYNQLVPQNELEKLQNIKFSIYKLVPTRINLKAIVSVKLKNNNNSWVGADHCQAGSGSKVYSVEEYNLKNGISMLRNVN